jgi:hypothetical protein
MASSALVNDISGVWSKGETRRITSNPMKAANMNTKRPLISVELILPPFQRNYLAGAFGEI